MKSSTLFIFAALGAVSGLVTGMPVARARQPLPEAHLKIHVEAKANGMADVVVENLENEHAEIDLHQIHHLPQIQREDLAVPPGHPLPPIHRPIHVIVPPHQVVRSEFPVQMPEMGGTTVVHFQSRVTLGRGKVKNGPSVYHVYRVTPRGLQEVSYEEGFLTKRVAVLKPNEKSRPAQLKLGGNFVANVEMARQAFNAHVLPASEAAKIQPVRLGSALEMADKFALRHLPPAGGKSQGRSGISEESFENVIDESVLANQMVSGFALERPADVAANKTLMSSFTMKGHMSTKYDDGSFHAAWGWVVTAWQWDQFGPLQMYMPLGWTYVNGDGSWQIPLASFAQSSKVFIQYQTANRFVQLQDPKGNVYTWGDWWNLTGNVTDIGYRYADLSASGDLPGIDKLYEGATEEWSRFYYNGMNALRDKPIEVTYPNSLTSGHCIENKDGSGNTVAAYAWSCSEWGNGKIWVIPAHGDKSVVQHEAAHSINSYYWNGNMSSGAGGAHSLDGCYNGGLALTEGFADFITYWVQFQPGTKGPVASYFGEDLDAYNSDNSCSSGEINEMRVAATFWDMYDTQNDGPDKDHYDGWNYISQAAPVSIYLNNGTKQKMSDYLSIVDAGDPNWYAADRALFRLNKIIK